MGIVVGNLWRKRAKKWGRDGRSEEVRRHIIRRMFTFRGIIKYDNQRLNSFDVIYPFLKDNAESG